MTKNRDIAGTAIGQLVAEQPSRAGIFEELGIDYYCGGSRTLAEACGEQQIAPDAVIDRLRAKDDGSVSTRLPVNPSAMSLTALADHIETTHHAYLQQTLPFLGGLFEKVMHAHGEKHAWLAEARDVFGEMYRELAAHMMKEEQVLFPMIRRIEAGDAMAAAHCGALGNPIQVMVMEHDQAGDALGRLRELSGGFNVPDGACDSFRALLVGLAEMDRDMHQHMHKENNILFPRSLEKAG